MALQSHKSRLAPKSLKSCWPDMPSTNKNGKTAQRICCQHIQHRETDKATLVRKKARGTLWQMQIEKKAQIKLALAIFHRPTKDLRHGEEALLLSSHLIRTDPNRTNSTGTRFKPLGLHHVLMVIWNSTHAQIVTFHGFMVRVAATWSPTLEHESKHINIFFFLVTLAYFSLILSQIAVEGCCHGSLDKIYEVLTTAEQREGCKIDLLICCGDFQVQLSSLLFIYNSEILFHCAFILHGLTVYRQFVMMRTSAAWHAPQSTATWRHSTSTTLERRRLQFWLSL